VITWTEIPSARAPDFFTTPVNQYCSDEWIRLV